MMCFTIKKDPSLTFSVEFSQKNQAKKVQLVNKTCCCVKLTSVQVVLPIILVIFIDGLRYFTGRNEIPAMTW